MFYPFRRLDRARVLADLRAVDRGLRELARAHGATAVALQPAWYGLDPIHVRARSRDEAWSTVFAAWPPRASGASCANDAGTSSLLWARPERRWLAGWEQRGAQPARLLAGGGTLSLY